jgi:hypothetical protein
VASAGTAALKKNEMIAVSAVRAAVVQFTEALLLVAEHEQLLGDPNRFR